MSLLSRSKLSPSLLRKDEEQISCNIMFDKRVVRGNTYALPLIKLAQKSTTTKPRKVVKTRTDLSPAPVQGRVHIHVQTELYLEELAERIEEVEAQIQTDAFIDRPQSPLFVPAKTGMDESTQIYEGDLFDFDIEVVPVLQVLIGKTIEQSLLEVMEEDELANLEQQQRMFQQLRDAELVEQQRLEEQDRRYREEKERRIKEQQKILLEEEETARKIAARAFATSYLSDLVPSVFGSLQENGYFYDPVERELERVCLPVLMRMVCTNLEFEDIGRKLMDDIIIHVCAEPVEVMQPVEDANVQVVEDVIPETLEGVSAENLETVEPVENEVSKVEDENDENEGNKVEELQAENEGSEMGVNDENKVEVKNELELENLEEKPEISETEEDNN